MYEKKSLTFVLMDAPFENERTVTGLRLVDVAARRGYEITVFAYEGAVALPFASTRTLNRDRYCERRDGRSALLVSIRHGCGHRQPQAVDQAGQRA